jgi:hypothetical protein
MAQGFLHFILNIDIARNTFLATIYILFALANIR